MFFETAFCQSRFARSLKFGGSKRKEIRHSGFYKKDIRDLSPQLLLFSRKKNKILKSGKVTLKMQLITITLQFYSKQDDTNPHNIALYVEIYVISFFIYLTS